MYQKNSVQFPFKLNILFLAHTFFPLAASRKVRVAAMNRNSNFPQRERDRDTLLLRRNLYLKVFSIYLSPKKIR